MSSPLSASSLAARLAARVIHVLPRQSITRAVGHLCDAELPGPVCRAVVGAYSYAYDIDLSEVVPRATPYESFDSFFTRPIQLDRRPLSTLPNDIVSPSDGRLQCLGTVEPGCRIVVKGRPYDVARLVGEEAEAKSYLGGQFAVVYLSPRDYHRVHSPVDGRLMCVRSMPGDFYPVNGLGERCRPDLFVANRRVSIAIETEAHGTVTVVMVAAMIVGRISAPSTLVPRRSSWSDLAPPLGSVLRD
jgi:phosphatidylserine decarboxylase